MYAFTSAAAKMRELSLMTSSRSVSQYSNTCAAPALNRGCYCSGSGASGEDLCIVPAPTIQEACSPRRAHC